MLQKSQPELKIISFIIYYWNFVWLMFLLYWTWIIYIFEGWVSHYFTLLWYPVFLLFSMVISTIAVIKFINTTKKLGKPVSIKAKIMLFLLPYIASVVLYSRYIYVQEWDYSKFKSYNANQCFQNENFKYLPDNVLTEECKLNSFKYLKLKFENVSIVHIDKNTTTFRIGSMNEDAILGKDYILMQKNINYKLIGIYNWRFFLRKSGLNLLHKTNGSKMFSLICWYSLTEKGSRKSIIRTIKTFKGNIYTKVFWRFDGMVSWILKNFKQFKKISK